MEDISQNFINEILRAETEVDLKLEQANQQILDMQKQTNVQMESIKSVAREIAQKKSAKINDEYDKKINAISSISKEKNEIKKQLFIKNFNNVKELVESIKKEILNVKPIVENKKLINDELIASEQIEEQKYKRVLQNNQKINQNKWFDGSKTNNKIKSENFLTEREQNEIAEKLRVADNDENKLKIIEEMLHKWL